MTAQAEPRRAPSAERNLEPILMVLRHAMPATGKALEIASGTGQHIAAFAEAFSALEWHPSDLDPEARETIAAWAGRSGLANLRPPKEIDTTATGWHGGLDGPYDAVLCTNMIHIAPWAACEGLMQGAGALLRPGGLLFLYGPYRRDNRHTAPSNEAFDDSLRSRNASWGIRDMEAVVACALASGIKLEDTIAMPANNFSLIFRRTV